MFNRHAVAMTLSRFHWETLVLVAAAWVAGVCAAGGGWGWSIGILIAGYILSNEIYYRFFWVRRNQVTEVIANMHLEKMRNDEDGN